MKKICCVVKKTLISVSVLALIAGGSVYGIFRHAEPAYSGHERMSGLSAPVRIFRDQYGVPHIFATSPNDAARALGYVHAGERLFQMEMQRRAGQGRLSELIGLDMLGVDKFIRTLGLYKLAQSSFAAMSPDTQSYFEAYADGVNQWLQTHPNSLPPEFLLLGAKPEPWRAADSVVWGKLMALELSHNYHLELLRAELATKFPPEQLQWLFPMPPAGTPVTTQPGVSTQTSDAGDQLAHILGLGHAASNEWVIGGTRTVTGKPMLANDPHLDLGVPILWYLARIVTPQGSVKGATVPGLPIILLGQNDHLAWGFTTTGSDVQDLFVETIDPANADHYLTPDGSAAFDAHQEIIHVKGAPDVMIAVRVTRHGPVMSDVSGEMAKLAGVGKVMALAFTGLGDKDTTSESILHINRAHNVAEFMEALKLYQTPPQNIVYADDEGDFGYINPGLVPVRKEGDGLMPVDGASGGYDWVGTIPLDHVPQIANPAAGYAFNANNAVVAADNADYFGVDWEEPYRARRLQQYFDATNKFTLQQSSAMQADHVSLAARDFLPMLLSLDPADVRGKQALAMLRDWNAQMDERRSEPAIFEAWLYEFHRHMLNDKTGVDTTGKGPFAAMTLTDLVAHHAADWCGDEGCRKIATQSLSDALDLMTARQGNDMLQWRWGRENVARLTHKFYSHIPILDKFSDLSIGSGGDFYTLDRGGGFDNDAEHPFARTHGGGYRGIYDLADPDASLFMIATGQSDHLFSRHYGDLVGLWENVKAITLAGTPDDLQKRGASELVLEPQ